MKNKTIILLVIIILLSIIPIVSILLIIRKAQVLGINIGVILLVLKVSYLILSFGTVKMGEVAVILFLGKPILEPKPGPYLALLGLMSVRKEKGTFFQDELPAEPENIFRGDGSAPDGMFSPIRVKFGMPDKDNDDKKLAEDPYNVAIVAEVVPVVAWRIASPIVFFEKMGTIENCKKILSDKAIETFGGDFSTMTPAKALLDLRKISQKMEKQLREATEPWGIELKDAYVKPFNFSHSLNDAVVDVVKAEQKAKAIVKTAGAERQKRIEEGIGTAEAERLLLEARAIGIEKLAQICKTPEGQITLWMDTMAKAFEKAQYSIVPGSELFTATSGIKEMLDKIKGGIK